MSHFVSVALTTLIISTCYHTFILLKGSLAGTDSSQSIFVVGLLVFVHRDPVNLHGFLFADFFFHSQAVVIHTSKAVPVTLKLVFTFLAFDKRIALFKPQVLVEIKQGCKLEDKKINQMVRKVTYGIFNRAFHLNVPSKSAPDT